MVNYSGTFYIVESNKTKAAELMAAFLMGENCPNCPEQPGRTAHGWACECITYENTADDYEFCDCDECQNWNEYETETN
jgi:hypothetical protein